MPVTTERLGLKKPQANETVNLQTFNDNYDVLEEKTALKDDVEDMEIMKIMGVY